MNFIPVYNFDLLPILLSIIFLSIVVLWVAIKNYENFLLMFLIIPLTIFSGWTAYSTVDKLLGYPVFAEVETDSLYITHIEDPMGDFIFLWVINPGELRPKSIMIINSEENKKAVEEAQEKGQQGIPQMLKQTAEDGAGQTIGGSLESYDFQNESMEIRKNQQLEDERNAEPRQLPGKVHTRPASGTNATPRTGFNADDNQPSNSINKLLPNSFRVQDEYNLSGK